MRALTIRRSKSYRLVSLVTSARTQGWHLDVITGLVPVIPINRHRAHLIEMAGT